MDTGRQKTVVLKTKQAYSYAGKLISEGYDVYTSAPNKKGLVVVMWPASTRTGKQLERETV